MAGRLFPGRAAGFLHARGRRTAERAAGFSLLEVLAAFVILSLFATSLFGLFSGALGNASAAEDWSRALLVAQSRLAAAASVQPLAEAADAGTEDEGRIRWETRVAPWNPPEVDPELARISEGMTTRLYRVEVDVRFPGIAGGERSIALATVRLAGKDLPQ
jgi:general secretion pathway protein I